MSYDILWYDEMGSLQTAERGREILIVERMRNPETDSRIIGAQPMSLLIARLFYRQVLLPFIS